MNGMAGFDAHAMEPRAQGFLARLRKTFGKDDGGDRAVLALVCRLKNEANASAFSDLLEKFILDSGGRMRMSFAANPFDAGTDGPAHVALVDFSSERQLRVWSRDLPAVLAHQLRAEPERLVLCPRAARAV